MICLERDGEEFLGFVGGNMDELEEGEACSYHVNDNNNVIDDSCVDPDIDLSYIDEKLQDVLGHFQKDFEGGVSAENLGAKFGGYGSFLPTTSKRSPVGPQPKTPPKTQQNYVPKSPNTFQVEGVRRSSIYSSNASQSLRPGSASANVATVHASKASSSLSDSAKKEVCIPFTDFAEEFPLKLESVKKRNAPDPKLLKVRIKMGSDNLSIQNNAAIYSGLGLDVSPSSSPYDSPTESEDLSHEPQGTPFESPAQIIQIMTCFPVHGGVLLSPLSDDLFHLIRIENLPKDSGSLPVPRGGPQGSGNLVNGSDSVKSDRKISGGKFTKLSERNEISTNLKIENIKDIEKLEGLTCEELLSHTLKLPIVSNSVPADGVVRKGENRDFIPSKEVNKGATKNTALPDLTKKEQLVRSLNQENGLIDNPKSSINGKTREDKKSCSVDSASLLSRKDGRHKREKPDDFVKVDSSSSMGKRGLNSELSNLSKEKSNQITSSYEQEGMKLPSGKDSSFSDGKKLTKGSQGKAKVSADNVPKDSSRTGSSSTSKSKKSAYEDNHTTEGEQGDIKSQKQTGKTKDRYRDFFGDIELEQENRMSPSEMSSGEERAKIPDVAEKITIVTSSNKRVKSSGKKPDKQLISEVQPKAASSVPPLAANGSIFDAAPATVAPMVEENWVCCDKCQTWRLLPLGKNPQDLPEKWLCSMLNWLPGMNKCGFTEEETTIALRALYQVPAPVGQSNLHGNTDGNGITSTAFADVRLSDQNQHNVGSHVMPGGGKKKQGLKDCSNIHYKDGDTQFPNSTKKMTESMVSINDVKRSTIGDESDYVKLSKSTEMVVEKSKHKKKEKLKGHDNRLDEGDTKRSKKVKSKRDHHQENSRSSKKIRNDVLMENWMPDHGRPIEKAGPSLINGQLTMSSGKNITKKDERPFLNDNGNRESNSVMGDAKVDAICVQDPTLAKQTLPPQGVMASKREKSHTTVPSRGFGNDTVGHRPQPTSEPCIENGTNSLPVSASPVDNASKEVKKNREVEHQNGIHPNSMRNPSSSSHVVNDVDGQSPVKRDSVTQAANNAIREAKNLKHMADRLKNSGSTESSRLYLEAILKFLNAASLLESNGSENGRTGDMILSIQMYSSTGKLCEFCAHEFERSKDMATAALAYKCMEVALMRVIYASHSSASRDRTELQIALQMNPAGESPSSSASDVDNLNHPSTADKVTLAKDVSSPQVAGNLIISARNRPHLVRLLNYTQDLNSAMEASRKSRIALSAANPSLGNDLCRETIKRALDFSFQDVEGFVPLVRLAIEAISSQK